MAERERLMLPAWIRVPVAVVMGVAFSPFALVGAVVGFVHLAVTEGFETLLDGVDRVFGGGRDDG